jgi:hypothetical protein
MAQVNLDLSDDLLDRMEMTAKTAGLSVEQLIAGRLEEFFDPSQPDFFKFAAPDNLSSEKEVDYSILRFYLKQGNWEEADYQTYLAVLKCYDLIEGQVLQEIINAKNSRSSSFWYDSLLELFPVTDMKVINQLWSKYSQGKFGFSAQKKVYIKSINCQKNFALSIGWSIMLENKTYKTVDYNNLNFSLDAPVGHLPSYRFLDADGLNRYNFINCFIPVLIKRGL